MGEMPSQCYLDGTDRGECVEYLFLRRKAGSWLSSTFLGLGPYRAAKKYPDSADESEFIEQDQNSPRAYLPERR